MAPVGRRQLQSAASMRVVYAQEVVITIARERPRDGEWVRRLHEEAFGRRAEANLVDALRSAGKAVVSLVVVEKGEIVGHVVFSKVTIGDGRSRSLGLALAPVAVLPSHQGRGIG